MLLYPFIRFFAQRIDSCSNGCNNKGDNQRGPEIQVPVIHKTAVFATTIIKVADTVEKPWAIMLASFRNKSLPLYTRFVISSPTE